VLASAGHDGMIRLWDAVPGLLARKPDTGETHQVTALAVLAGPDGKTMLASATYTSTIQLWDAATGRPTGQLRTGHKSWITALAVLPGPDGMTLLASASGTCPRMLDI